MSDTDPIGFVQAAPRDRAWLVSGTILGIVTDALRDWWHGEPVTLADVRGYIASVLRDEFDDIHREAAGERSLAD
jgi:hypothetical protein